LEPPATPKERGHVARVVASRLVEAGARME
jgi:hypothetical protein